MITFESFKRIEGTKLPTWELPLSRGAAIRVEKFDEDAEQGYGYTIYRVAHGYACKVTSAYFDGFGNDDRPGDVIHTIRLMLEE